ncbi:putative rhamnogalacturonase A precursor protein [Rutstroemia sp. NJR-2017a WRK4]|nr:putative rhamnogalacturonase A precursor protein [Rutstroemia sp. NJR-2017a WRK4]
MTTAGTYGPRILRLYEVTNFSVHDLILVDSPAFHLTLDTCTNGEIYNMVVRGGNEGGLDGIDVWGTNIWVHDVEVTNKDECVTVKSPASHILVENVYCNWSGGCAIGSLGADTAISNVEYNHIYSHHCNQMMMIKSNGGSGSLKSATFNNFMGHSNAYTLDIDTAWTGMTPVSGSGVSYSDLTFSHWHGTCANGAARAPIQLLCPAAVPCTGLTISSFYIWTDAGSVEYYKCNNAYGSGPCLHTATSHTTYTSTGTVTSVPTASYAYTTMPGELTAGLGITTSIAIPTHPASYFPGIAPYSALLG